MPEHQPHSYANEHAPYEQFPPFSTGQVAEIEKIPNSLKSAYSGKIEINYNEEIEPSATERKLVTLLIQTRTNTRTFVKIKVNKIEIGATGVDVTPVGETFLTATFLVPASQKFEVELGEGVVEKIFWSAITI